MSELWLPRSAAAPAPDTTSHTLTRRAGRVASRLADVVERTGGDDQARRAAAFLREWVATAGHPPLAVVRVGNGSGPPLDRLAARLDLASVEADLLLLAGLAEEHEGIAQTLRALHPTGEPRPTVGLAVHVLADDADRDTLHRVLQEGSAVRSGALVVPGQAPFFERSLLVADGLWAALHGHHRLPAALAPVPVPAAPAGLSRWAASAPSVRAVRALQGTAPQVVIVTTDDETVGLSRCARLAADAGVPLLAARPSADDPAAAQLLQLHALAQGAVPLLLPPADDPSSPHHPLDLPNPSGPLLVVSRNGGVRPPAGTPVLPVPTGPVDAQDRRAAWQSALPHLGDQAARLAARYPLDPAWTAQVAEDLRARSRLAADDTDGDGSVTSAVRARATVALPAGVAVLTPSEEWDRLVVAPEAAAELRQVVDRMAHQSVVLDDWDLRRVARATRGVRLLFTGLPGTGKSLAAEVVASALDTDLMVVDVSHVVSKWLGETSKHLAAVFDAAERSRAVLLLDEADALFASRTEVTDAHDRYANLDSAYLLQRMDTFDGLVVLTTNLRQNIDPAFIRRMDHVVEFGLPGRDQRQRLWEQHLPEGIRSDDVDLAALAARYAVPGAWIRNASIAAAFLAAAAAGPVGQRHLVDSVRREYAKAGRPFPAAPHEATADQRAIRALEQASGLPAMEDRT